MEHYSDVAVVGGGPCGSFAALHLAKHGFSTTVFEEHAGIGFPSHCAGHLSIKNLRRLGLYPLPESIVENTIRGANFYSPRGGVFSVRFPSPVTCVVNRALFDKHISEMAEKAGAKYCLGSRVSSLLLERGSVRGVKVAHKTREETSFAAKIVVDAEGISSRLLSSLGLSTLNRAMVVNAVQAEVDGVEDVESDAVDVFVGREYAPGFYGWLIPRRDGTAKVGLGTKSGNPRESLKRLITKHPVASRKLRNARLLKASFHPITLGGPIRKAYSDGFLAVGDVASQVKPTTGGGVILGLTCSKIAAEVAKEALLTSDFSSEFLSAYQNRIRETLGFDMKVMLWIRRALDALSDKQLNDAIDFCAKFGVEETLQKVSEIDFQGRALLRLLPNPRMATAIAYFLYLSANP